MHWYHDVWVAWAIAEERAAPSRQRWEPLRARSHTGLGLRSVLVTVLSWLS